MYFFSLFWCKFALLTHKNIYNSLCKPIIIMLLWYYTRLCIIILSVLGCCSLCWLCLMVMWGFFFLSFFLSISVKSSVFSTTMSRLLSCTSTILYNVPITVLNLKSLITKLNQLGKSAHANKLIAVSVSWISVPRN